MNRRPGASPADASPHGPRLGRHQTEDGLTALLAILPMRGPFCTDPGSPRCRFGLRTDLNSFAEAPGHDSSGQPHWRLTSPIAHFGKFARCPADRRRDIYRARLRFRPNTAYGPKAMRPCHPIRSAAQLVQFNGRARGNQNALRRTNNPTPTAGPNMDASTSMTNDLPAMIRYPALSTGPSPVTRLLPEPPQTENKNARCVSTPSRTAGLT